MAVDDEGVLYMSVGLLDVEDDDEPNMVDHPVFFCPFCGTKLQTPERNRRQDRQRQLAGVAQDERRGPRMADTFKFELVTPERMVLSEDARQVVVPGMEGDFTVLAGHAPVISALRPGVIDAHAGAMPASRACSSRAALPRSTPTA